MYTPETFLQAARQYLSIDVSSATIEDVQRISSESRVSALLLAQRMSLPALDDRVSALSSIYEKLAASKATLVGDLNALIGSLGGEFTLNPVNTPLFFSLIKEAYGPLVVELDLSKLLRDRAIIGFRTGDSPEAFTEQAHAAWLAQALYRVRLESLGDEQLLPAFFGESVTPETIALYRRAQEFARLDEARRG